MKNQPKATITGLSMEKYGLNCLTGEACAYGLRLLFDVNDDGRQLLKDFLGMPDICLSAYWNPEVNGKPATGSIMLPREIWLPLAIFIMFHVEGCDFVLIQRDGTNAVHGFVNEDVEKGWPQEEVARHFDIRRNFASKDPAISRNGRNVHQFTKRVV